MISNLETYGRKLAYAKISYSFGGAVPFECGYRPLSCDGGHTLEAFCGKPATNVIFFENYVRVHICDEHMPKEVVDANNV